MSTLPHASSSRRPHLLQLVHAYPPAVGGVELSTRDLCERLVRDHGFEVTVLTTNVLTVSGFRDPRQPLLPTGEETVNGVRVVRYPVQAGWARALRPLQAAAYRLRLPGNDLLRTLWSGPIAPALRRAVRDAERVDVICAASFPLNQMRYAFAAPSHRRPPVVLIGAVHTNDPWAYDRPNMLRLVDRSFATVAHTEHERAWLVEQGCDATHIRVIGHGIDPGEIAPRAGAFRATHGIAEDAYLAAYVGQQGAHKGLEVLLRSATSVLSQLPTAWIAIAGATTPYSPELRRLAGSLPPDVRERVVIADDVSDQEKADVLGDCDVFVSASRAESFGITTLEAWSVGKPVIVGDAPSQREIVQHGETGLIVPAGDPTALAAAITHLAEAPDIRARLGANGRTVVSTRYRRGDVERQYAELFLDAMDAPAGEASHPSSARAGARCYVMTVDAHSTTAGGPPATPPRVSVLVVNWNTKDECLACLDSLAEAAGSVEFETIVVDNDSRDGSVEALAAREDIDLILNDINIGFAAAVNQAYEHSHGELVLLLNSDVEFEAGQLGRLVAFLNERPDAAGAAPLYRNPDGTAQPFHFALPSYGAVLGMSSAPLRRLPWIARRVRDHAIDVVAIASPIPVPQPSASCLLLRRSCLPTTEVLDERFPIFFNDVQLARSLAARGHTLWLTPDVTVTHVGHASTRQLGGALRRQYIASLVRLLETHEPRRRVWLYRLVVFAQGIVLYLVRKPGQLSPRQLWLALAGDTGALPAAPQRS